MHAVVCYRYKHIRFSDQHFILYSVSHTGHYHAMWNNVLYQTLQTSCWLINPSYVEKPLGAFLHSPLERNERQKALERRVLLPLLPCCWLSCCHEAKRFRSQFTQFTLQTSETISKYQNVANLPHFPVQMSLAVEQRINMKKKQKLTYDTQLSQFVQNMFL